MLTAREVKELLVNTHPEDGFRVLDVTVSTRHALYVVFRSEGVRVDLPGREQEAYLVWEADAPSAEKLGEKARVKLLVDAMCRYVNTGGDPADLCDWGEHVQTACNGAIVAMPGGFRLIDSDFNSEGRYEHLFRSPQSNQVVRWVENQFLDVFPITTLQREKAANDAAERDAEVFLVETGEAGDPADVRGLERPADEDDDQDDDPGELPGQAAPGS